MKAKSYSLLILILLIVNALSAYHEKQDHKILFEKAVYTMETKADLKEAITLFDSLIQTYPEEREYAANAQFHIGLCYEKLGNQEAQKAYQEVIRKYGDQLNIVNIARDRLSRLILMAEKIDETSITPRFTKVKIPTKLSWSVRLSPDGKSLALVSEEKIWIMPLTGKIGPDFPGTPFQLNTGGIDVEYTDLSWSYDGQWIAFNDPGKEGPKQGIYVVSAAGGKPEKIIENYRDARIINYRISLSPDGKHLAFSSVEDNKQHLFTISTQGGNPIQLTNMQAREPAFSPDGKRIAYVEDQDLGAGQGGLGLWVVPYPGGTPHLVAEAGTASSPVWSPDGKMIAFLDYSQRGHSYSNQINIVPVSYDGKSAGKITKIDIPEGIESVRMLAGWTPDDKIGALCMTKQEFAIYKLPAKGGQAAMVLPDCYTLQPRFSHDSKKIFYVTPPIEGDNRMYRLRLASVSADGGTGKPLPRDQNGKVIRQLSYQGGNRISPDGKMIISAAWTPADTSSEIQFPTTEIWKIAIDGSKSVQLTNKQGPYADMCPSWSPDGHKVAFLRKALVAGMDPFGDEQGIYIINASGGEPDLLISQSDKAIFSPVWSPDGDMIAYMTGGPDPAMNIINIHNAESKVIGKVPRAGIHIELAWSPDSKRIAFNGENIHVMNLTDGSIEDIETNLVDVGIWHFDWSPDGEQFVFSGGKGGNDEFWFMEDFLPLERLAQKSKTGIVNEPEGIALKQVWTDSETDNCGSISPDGRYLSYVDWETGDLAIYEIATGKKRHLTNKGSWDESDEYALNSRWSPDGKQIVYEWYTGKDYCELRTIGLDGSKPSILYSNKEVDFTHPNDWSPDGKQILAYFENETKTGWITQIVLVSTADGSVRVLKTFNGGWPENMCFSPDGNFIVYDFSPDDDAPDRDIFLLSTDGSHEIPLIEYPSHDELLGWTPDGEKIIFNSDRNGTMGIWTIQVNDGESQGNPKLIKSDMGPIEPLGFTRAGSFYYGISRKMNDIYTAELDPATGKISAPPKKAIKRFEGYNQTPIYSPDGKNLAYISRRFPLTVLPDYTIAKIGGNVLCIKSLETGKGREIVFTMCVKILMLRSTEFLFKIWKTAQKRRYIDPVIH